MSSNDGISDEETEQRARANPRRPASSPPSSDPRRVHFPLYDRIQSTENARRNVSPRNSSPLTVPPIINEDESCSSAKSQPEKVEEKGSSVDDYEEDDGHAYEYESTDDSTRQLIPPPQPAQTINQGAAASMVGANSYQNLLDVGLHTSGGLAPGATDHDQHARNQGIIDENEHNAGDEFGRRRSSLLRRIESLRQRHGELSRAIADREAGNDVSGASVNGSLTELDHKLKQIQEIQEEANETARNLVRTHTVHDKSTTKDDEKNPTATETTEVNDEKKQSDSYLVEADDFTAAENDYDTYGYSQGNGDLPPPDQSETQRHHEDYVAPPSKVRQGVLGSLLKLYGDGQSDDKLADTPAGSQHSTPTNSEPPTPRRRSSHDGTTMSTSALAPPPVARPKLFKNHSTANIMSAQKDKEKRPKWYQHKTSRSTASLGELVLTSAQTFTAPGSHAAEAAFKPTKKIAKKVNKKMRKQKMKLEEELRITIHIADVLQRQRFIIRMCRALLLYGAPTHRLEEYIKMTARVLEINCQCFYVPGCMVISFDDATTHTSDMQLIRCIAGLNLAKLNVAHQIYKEVVHDVVGVEEASQRVDELLAKKNRYPLWLTLIFFGLAAAAITPFVFGGYWPDVPISFVLSMIVGYFQIVIAPRSSLYSNVFEIGSSIFVSFIGRVVGSVGTDQDIFCFAGITQGALVLILPGYTILCGSLELQSKNIVAGSVRMFYAIIYSLFLGFGITLGAAIYGWIDSNATSKTTCHHPVNPYWNILFVPAFSVFVATVNQASLRQLPVMTLISSAGYTVTYFINRQVPDSSEFTAAIGAFVIGILGNLYSRVGHGLAFAAMLPGILVQVPGSLASKGSFIAGIKNADQIVSNGTRPQTTTQTGPAGVPIATTVIQPTRPPDDGGIGSGSEVLTLGISMVQISIGISVGLFLATLVIYPFGKKRTGLFTF